MAEAKWYWIYGMHDGRRFRAGPYSTREKASSEGIKLCGADFEVFELPTQSTVEAGRMMKHILATRAGNAGEGFIKHNLQEGSEQQKQQDERW